MTLPAYQDFWAITKYSDIREIERNSDIFTNAPAPTLVTRKEYEARAAQPVSPVNTLIQMDGDVHKAHRNIVAFFHGHENYNEFYTWRGPDGDLALPVFRADSPMKGRDSRTNETKLSIQVVTYDTATRTLTARECLWNAPGGAAAATAPVAWGASKTITLAVH